MKKLLASFVAALLLCLPARAALLKLTVPRKAPVGQPFFVEARFGEPVGDVTITWRGRAYVFRPRNGAVRTILGVPNDAALAGAGFPLTVEFVSGSKRRFLIKREVTATARAYPEDNLTVPPEMVSPGASEKKRVRRERALVRSALSRNTKGGALPRAFARPVPGVPTACFGSFRVFNGVRRAGHNGLDLRAVSGTRVKSLHRGVVVLAGRHYFSGNAVYIDHGGGVFSSYCHLSKILVRKGEKIAPGGVVGLSGATGRVTGPHLHLGIYAGGTWLDALPLLGEAPLPEGVETVYRFG